MFRKIIKIIAGINLVATLSLVSAIAKATESDTLSACQAQKKVSELLLSDSNAALKLGVSTLSTFGLDKTKGSSDKIELACAQQLALAVVKFDSEASIDGYLYDIYSDSPSKFQAAKMTLSVANRNAIDGIIHQQAKLSKDPR